MAENDGRLAEQYAPRAQQLLRELVSRPSIAAQGIGIEETAGLVESLLQGAGFTTQQLRLPDIPPMIYGEQRGRSPYTLLLYNHYDVQPPEPLELWDSPPFVPTIRAGKLFGRGISDNKGEIAVRLAAIEALRDEDGELPITIKWVIEGEEEIGSVHFGDIIKPHAGLLKADGCFWEGTGIDDETGRPALMLGAKGMLYVQLHVRCLSHDAHSGGASFLPSAAWRLVQALGTLKNRGGTVQLPGFYDSVRKPTQEELDALHAQPDKENILRQEYGVTEFLNGLHGEALREQSTFSPTCNIAGIWSGYTGDGIKTVLPAEANAKLDFRLVPHQDPEVVLAALRQHLDDGGFGDIDITVLGSCAPTVTPMANPFARRVLDLAASFDGKPPIVAPLANGSLPLLGALEKYVGVPGLGAPTNIAYWGSRAHAPNENIRLADIPPAIASAIHLFRGLGESDGSTGSA